MENEVTSHHGLSAHTDAASSPEKIEHAELEIENADIITADDVTKYSKHDDEAMKAMANYDGPPLVLDEATNKRILWKIDTHLMPVL